jgi:hypothetical protein
MAANHAFLSGAAMNVVLIDLFRKRRVMFERIVKGALRWLIVQPTL